MKLPLQTEDEGLSMTSMMDVIFLLLIFFLVATRFSEEEREITTRLAEVLQARPIVAGERPVIVNVMADGTYKVEGTALDEDGLVNVLTTIAAKNRGTTTVQIRADQEVKFLYPAIVMGICEREQLKHTITVLQKK